MVTGEHKLTELEVKALEVTRADIDEANKREQDASMRGLAAVLSAPRLTTAR